MLPSDQRQFFQQGHNSFAPEDLHSSMQAANLAPHLVSQPTPANGMNGMNRFLPNAQLPLSQMQMASLLQQQAPGLQQLGARFPPGPQMLPGQDMYGLQNNQQPPRLLPSHAAALDAAWMQQLISSGQMFPPSMNQQLPSHMPHLHSQGLLSMPPPPVPQMGLTPEMMAYTSQFYGPTAPRPPPMAGTDSQLAMALASLPPARLAELHQAILQQQNTQAILQQMEAHTQLVNASSELAAIHAAQHTILSGLAGGNRSDAPQEGLPRESGETADDGQPANRVTSVATALLNGQLSPRAVLNNRQSPTQAGLMQPPSLPHIRPPAGSPAEMALIQSVLQGMNLQDGSDPSRQFGPGNNSPQFLQANSSAQFGSGGGSPQFGAGNGGPEPFGGLDAMPRRGLQHQHSLPLQRPNPLHHQPGGRMPLVSENQPLPGQRLSFDMANLAPQPTHPSNMGRYSLDVPLPYPYSGSRRSSMETGNLQSQNSVGSGRMSLEMGMNRHPPLSSRLSLDMPTNHSGSGRLSFDLGGPPGRDMSGDQGGHLMDGGMVNGRPQVQLDGSAARRRSMEVQQGQAAARAMAGADSMLGRTASAPVADFIGLSMGGGGGVRLPNGTPFQLPGMPPPAGMAPSSKEEYKRTMLVQIGEQMARSNISVEQAISAGLLGGMCAADVRVLCNAHGAEVGRMQAPAEPLQHQPMPLEPNALEPLLQMPAEDEAPDASTSQDAEAAGEVPQPPTSSADVADAAPDQVDAKQSDEGEVQPDRWGKPTVPSAELAAGEKAREAEDLDEPPMSEVAEGNPGKSAVLQAGEAGGVQAEDGPDERDGTVFVAVSAASPLGPLSSSGQA